MYRQLYQMGGMGIESLSPMQPAMQPAMQSAMYNPLQNTYNSGMPMMMAGGGRMGYQKGGSPEEEMENIKQFYYGRKKGEKEDLLDEYQRFKMRKDFLRRYPRDEARFGGRMGYPRTGIGSLTNRQGYFFGGIGDIVGDVFGGIGDVAGDVFGGIEDIGGDILGSVGDVLGDLDLGELMQIYQVAAPFVGLPPIPGGEFASFLPGSVPGGEGGLGSLGNILGNFGSFMPQEGGNSGFNPYQFATNLISGYDDNNEGPPREDTGGGIVDVLGTILGQIGGRLPESIDAITKLLSKNKELAALTASGTLSKLTYDEIKALNEELKRQYGKYETGKEAKRTQYRTPESRAQLPGYKYSGIPNTVADVYRAPAMKGGIMNVPMGQPRKNSVGVKELDYRKTGGFVPPVGVKEKADDIPAMLSNNEFVFTADAVRAAGGGSVNKGAKRMYSLMRQLEGRA